MWLNIRTRRNNKTYTKIFQSGRKYNLGQDNEKEKKQNFKWEEM